MNLRRTLAALLMLTTLAAAPSIVHALSLDDAKQRGLVGETATGYLGAVQSATAEVNTLIQSINAKRRAQYGKIAKRRNVSIQDVERLAGRKAIDKTARGQYVKAGGGWRKK